ncbi:hypothetical protein [Thiocystis violascens]|uniref:hypothetical protein n=1 Tax=Thiocystis violascens TaxID=73141 RepID=UPI00059BF0C9|nr:hypothetical protein [Thiocystis violascens]
MDVPETAEHDQLEQRAATVLGYMLFEYSRLDMELGLFLVWSDEGQKLDQLTSKLAEQNFYLRLKFLEKLAQEKHMGTPAADLYTEWLLDAHAIRSLRNQLFHGRWGFIPSKQLVVNVVGLPTSLEQSETRYSIEQLRTSLDSMRMLRARLSDLRKRWPV